MPEEPSLVILKEQIYALNSKQKEMLGVTRNTKIDKDRMLNKRVVDSKSCGKRFLICFEDFSLRIYSLIFESYRINERKDSPVRLRNGKMSMYSKNTGW